MRLRRDRAPSGSGEHANDLVTNRLRICVELAQELRTDAQIDEVGRSGGLVGITFHAGMLGVDGGLDASQPLGRVVDHVDHVVERIGVDHVGFGSDFDGCILPIELGDAAGLQRVAAALRDRGYKDEQVVKLAHGNWLRVLDETWA